MRRILPLLLSGISLLSCPNSFNYKESKINAQTSQNISDESFNIFKNYISECTLEYKLSDISDIDCVFDPSQALRIKKMLYSLDKRLRKEIGQLIRDDLNDPYSEHGGIIHYENGKIRFENLESLLKKENNIENNDRFRFPPDCGKAFAEYHLHAIKEDSSEYSFPSVLLKDNNELVGDLLRAYDKINESGEYHAFIITPLGRGIFNIDSYSGHLDKEENPRISVVDLGNYPY